MIKPNPTFLNSKYISEQEISKGMFVFIGVPSEIGCAGKLGTAKGPDAIRVSSLQYSWPEWNGFYEPASDKKILTNASIGDLGNIKNINNESLLAKELVKQIRKVIKFGGIPIILGGDHSITNNIVQGFSQPIQVVQLDAHGDYQRYEETDAFPSGVVMRKINDLSQVKKIVQVGMRGYLNSGLGFSDSRDDGNSVITWKTLKQKGAEIVSEELEQSIPVYLTIDTDFLDPSICPGTTVPEPDGPLYNFVQNIVKAILEKNQIIGFDVMELNPDYDPIGITSLHMSKLILDTMSYISSFSKKTTSSPSS